MNTSETPTAGTEPQRRGIGAPSARSLVALVAAAALVVVTVTLVLIFGIAHPPELVSLAEEPDPAPSASVAWISGEQERSCVYLATPDGHHEQLTCDEDELGEVVAWDDDGVVVRTWWPRDELRWFDPSTGEEVDAVVLDEPEEISRRHRSEISTRVRDGVLTVTVAESGEVLWAVEAVEGYRVNQGAVSPDGQWVAMFDSASRLLVVPADGARPPRVWAEDAAHWELPIWEGTELERSAP